MTRVKSQKSEVVEFQMGSIDRGWHGKILGEYTGPHDVVLVCAHGETVEAHKVVLALYSTQLWEIFTSGGEEEERLVILPPSSVPCHPGQGLRDPAVQGQC